MSSATHTRTAPAERSYPDYSQPLWKRLLLTRETAVIALTVAVILYSLVNVENFDGPLTLKFLLQDIAPILLIALPMTLIIITGEIDLSVASTVGLSSAVMGQLWFAGLPLETIVPLCLLLGAVLGAVNGFLVTRLGLPSLAVTIGINPFWQGAVVGALILGAIVLDRVLAARQANKLAEARDA